MTEPIYQHPLAFLIGMEGVALMKAFSGEFDREFTLARLVEVQALLDAADRLGEGTEVPPMSTVAGYDGWSATYDSPGNGIFEIEEPALLPLLERREAGVAVDAACGTGRLAAYLADRGHQVHGFDTSPGMLAVAESKVPAADFALADMRNLPMPDASADLIVNALALGHIEDLEPVFHEAARVLRPGGRFVISDTRGHFFGSVLYPLIKSDVDGNVGYLPTWRHATSEYVRAALPNGFVPRECLELLRIHPVADATEPLEPAIESPPDVWELMQWAVEAANAVYRDEPCVIVWDFELGADPVS